MLDIGTNYCAGMIHHLQKKKKKREKRVQQQDGKILENAIITPLYSNVGRIRCRCNGSAGPRALSLGGKGKIGIRNATRSHRQVSRITAKVEPIILPM